MEIVEDNLVVWEELKAEAMVLLPLVIVAESHRMELYRLDREISS